MRFSELSDEELIDEAYRRYQLGKGTEKMRLLKNQTFWMGAVVGIIVWQVVLPRVAPGLKAKLPLG